MVRTLITLVSVAVIGLASQPAQAAAHPLDCSQWDVCVSACPSESTGLHVCNLNAPPGCAAGSWVCPGVVDCGSDIDLTCYGPN